MHIPGKGYCYFTLHFPSLPKRTLEKRLTPLLSFLSAPLFCCREEQESNKDLFIPKAALCTALFVPAVFPLSWHSHPVTGLKVIQFPTDTMVGNLLENLFSRNKNNFNNRH